MHVLEFLYARHCFYKVEKVSPQITKHLPQHLYRVVAQIFLNLRQVQAPIEQLAVVLVSILKVVY